MDFPVGLRDSICILRKATDTFKTTIFGTSLFYCRAGLFCAVLWRRVWEVSEGRTRWHVEYPGPRPIPNKKGTGRTAD
jgi:hypothetical protein